MLVFVTAANAQTMTTPDITKAPTLFVVPYAHLDTQWRWEFPQTISQFLLPTMRVNFDYMDKYPHYVFNWTGANRYRLMKEYFPTDYARIKGYVARGQWFPAGSSLEEGDVNLPSAEGIFRQVLYGNRYFRHEFGKSSNEFMLPDSFGFPASLPTILAHAGLTGFSTQKLGGRWPAGPEAGGPNSSEQTPDGVPFNVGVWVGPDGKSVVAALHPGAYGSSIYTDLSEAPATSMEQTLLSTAQKPPLDEAQSSALRSLAAYDTDWVKRIDLDGGRIRGLPLRRHGRYWRRAAGVYRQTARSHRDKERHHTAVAAQAERCAVLSRTFGDSARRRRSGACDRVLGRSDVSCHRAGDDRTHAALRGRPGTDRPLRRLAHVAGLSQTLDHQG